MNQKKLGQSMLTGVTITGADDAVDPHDLEVLSAEFPFVEWGLLLSPTRAGTPRYPSPDWMTRLPPHLRRAVHFCGESTRATLAGNLGWMLVAIGASASRVQINGFVAPAPALVAMMRTRAHLKPKIEIILQARSTSEIEPAAAVAREIGVDRASVLFDPSGGRGWEPERWPSAPAVVRMGYAGGIRPETVFRTLRDLDAVTNSGSFWIDMESGVRDESDRFDLARAREVLHEVRRWSGAGHV